MLQSIAILPFANLSGDASQDYFGDGLSEEIINALTHIPSLQVTARTSSFAFKNHNLDVREIGQQLGVAHLLEGSFRMAGERVRITAQLVDVADGFHLWSDNFDRRLDDLLQVQDEISLIIADKLREYTGHLELGDQLRHLPLVPSSAYQRYLEARYLIQQFNPLSVQEGISILKELASAYLNFAEPHLGLSYTYTYLGAIGMMDTDQAFKASQQHIDQALAIDPISPEGLIRQAGIAFWQHWDYTTYYELLRKALAIQPGNAEAYLWIGVGLAAEGQFDAAHQYLDKALRLDPFSALFHDFKGMAFYFEGRYDEAIAKFEYCEELNPTFLMSQVNWAATELLQGKRKAGLKRFQELPPSGHADLSVVGGVALAKAMMGDRMAAEKGLTELQTALDDHRRDRAWFFIIIINIALGEHDIALDWLERGVAEHVSILITMPIEPYFKPLSPYLRFQRLAQKITPNTITSTATSTTQQAPPSKPEDFRTLEGLMREQQPYLDPQLSLRQLAELADLHPNYLSRLINEQACCNFAEYINTYRLRAFHNKAQDTTFTLLAIAYESGFNSKTVFNTFCKKLTGLTPKAFVRTSLDVLKQK